MKLFSYFVFVVFIALTAGCEKKTAIITEAKEVTEASNPTEAPKVDLTTPEKAIYSYQAIKNWKFSEEKRAYSKITKDYFEKLKQEQSRINSVSNSLYNVRITQIVKQNEDANLGYEFDSIPQYEFTIEEMKKETDTRVIAMVKVRNATPLKNEIKLKDENKKMRDEGEKFKFDLELDNGRWLISQISEWRSYSTKWAQLFKTPEPRDMGFHYSYVSLP